MFQVDPRLQTVFGLEPVQMRISPAHFGVRGGPSRIGHFARRVVRRCGILRQCIQGILLAQVFEKVFLPPAIKHPIRHLRGGQIAAGSKDGRLVAVIHAAGHLSQSQLALEQAHVLVG